MLQLVTSWLLTTCIYYFLHTTWIKHTTSASRVPWWWLSVFNAGDDDDPLKLGPVDDPVHNVSKLLYGNIVPSLLLTIWPSLSVAHRTRDCQPLFNFLFWCKLLIDLRIFCCARLVGNRNTYVTTSMTWETWEGNIVFVLMRRKQQNNHSSKNLLVSIYIFLMFSNFSHLFSVLNEGGGSRNCTAVHCALPMY